MPISSGTTARLLLIRHGESAWNLAQRFTGWADVGLTATGHAQMQELGHRLREEQIRIDAVFSSPLQRCMASATALLQASGQDPLPIHTDWRLNERHYGALTGLSKPAAVAEHGADVVRAWRRSYRALPPPLHARHVEDAPLWGASSERALPLSESLEHTVQRSAEAWKQCIAPALRPGATVAVVGHGNSLRGLAMQIEGLSEDAVADLEIANGEWRHYDFRPEAPTCAPSRIWRPSAGVASQIL